MSQFSGPLRGMFWMTMQSLSFAALAATVRALGQHDIQPPEMAFFRSIFGIAVVLPWAIRAGRAAWFPAQWKPLLLRNGLLFCGMNVWFAGLIALPISDAIAIQFTLPLFVVLGAGTILGENVGWRRWMAVVAGFIGALVIVRPGVIPLNAAAMLVLFSAVLYAGVHLMTKHLSANVPGPCIVLHMNLLFLPLGLVFSIPWWVTPGWETLGWLCALGVLSSLSHLFLIRAYAAADASFVEPFDFLRLPFSAVFGWLLFSELSDFWTWAGAALIFVAVSYNARYEARRAKS
jgi:drug/metabolite transporter (DMT)-like permease